MTTEQIIGAVFAVLSAILTAFVIPYLKSKLTTDQQDRLWSVIYAAVNAAEQIYKDYPKSGEMKKAHVLATLADMGIIKSATDIPEQINDMIEAAVFFMR